MYCAEVFETSSALFFIQDGNLYLKDSNGLYLSEMQWLFSDPNPETGSYLYVKNDGYWVFYRSKPESVFLGGKKPSSSPSSVPFFYGKEVEVASGEKFTNSFTDEDGIKKLSAENIDKNFLAGRFRGDFRIVNEKIFLRTIRSILCVDLDFNSVWEVPLTKRCFSSIEEIPQYHKSSDLIIVNVGEIPKGERGEFEINAYYPADGSLAWQHIIDKSPTCSNLIGDKVYVWDNEHILILDAATGAVLVNELHGYKHPEERSFSKGSLYPFEHDGITDLLLVCDDDGGIQINSADGKTIKQVIYAPDPYSISGNNPPVFHDDKIYVKLTHQDSYNNTMNGAFMVITPVDDSSKPNTPCSTTGNTLIKDTSICSYGVIAPRPPTLVELIKNENGDDVYCVSIEHDTLKSNAASKTLDDLIRFSTIALKETAFKYGSYTSSTETNKNHHGRLLLSVKSGGLQKTTGLNDEELLENLQVIKERVERNLADTGVQAGDGSSAFVVEIQLVGYLI
jgi:hypothetical protein